MIQAIIKYDFMQNAVVAAILASLICGIMGTIIVEKRLVSMSGGIAHSSFGGIGLGYLMGIEPIITGLLFASAASLGVGYLQRKTSAKADAVVSMFWSAGMALGILLISLKPGYPPDMTSYLFGDILAVNAVYLTLMAVMAFLMLLIVGSAFNYWKSYLFDEEYARIMGIKVVVFEKVLYIMIAMSVVILIKVVGIILALALLTIPPMIAIMFTRQLKYSMIIASVIGVFFSMVGLGISYYMNIPSGASIILAGVAGYGIAYAVKKHTRIY